jgi:hypothetical protein
MILSLDQIAILATGPPSIIMIGLRQPWRRWGFLVGLCGQPAWLYTCWMNAQWGIFIFSVFMVYAWTFGLLRNWESK